MTDPATTADSAPSKEILGHPRGLYTLFMTEMWERMSYYGMRAILILFMVSQMQDGGLAIDDVTATAIYGIYTAAVYLVALPGGWIADRLMGAQRAVLAGGIAIMCGQFVSRFARNQLVFPWLAAGHTRHRASQTQCQHHRWLTVRD